MDSLEGSDFWRDAWGLSCDCVLTFLTLHWGSGSDTGLVVFDAILTMLLLQLKAMKPTQQLRDLGQSLWLDNITRKLLTSRALRHYIDDISVTRLTSNPSIFDLAIKSSNFYEDANPHQEKTRQVRRSPLLRAGDRGPEAGSRSISADPRHHQWRRRLGFAGGLAAARA